MDEKERPVALDPATLPASTRTGYPPPLDEAMRGRSKRRVGDAFGLTRLGANLIELEPGAASSLRHWHHREDEFAWVVRGPVTLVTDAGERELATGMAAGFPAGVADGHAFVNRSDHPVAVLLVGSRLDEDVAEYPDHDLRAVKEHGAWRFTTRTGRPLP